MHKFDTLINDGASFTLNALDELQSKVFKQLQQTGSTSAVKNLQIIQMQKVILAIGMFSLFDSMLQHSLACQNGFKEARGILERAKKLVLLDRFNKFCLAVNVLKHGKGWSYDQLISQADSLPFTIKRRNENFFHEGDTDEVSTYIKIDNDFILNCADILQQVSKEIKENFVI